MAAFEWRERAVPPEGDTPHRNDRTDPAGAEPNGG